MGDPQVEGVRRVHCWSIQRDDVRAQVALQEESSIVYGSTEDINITGADSSKGAFLNPILLRSDNPMAAKKVHEIEVFGPVSTLIPYKDIAEAVELSKKGKGSLCCSITTHDKKARFEFIACNTQACTRILVLDRECTKESTGHGSPLPLLVHGGPGRAGGGEEMGGLRGIKHYMQRTAIQGHPSDFSHN